MATNFTVCDGYLIVGKATCPFCSGSGEVLRRKTCSSCGGSGRGMRGGERGCKVCTGTGEVFGPEMQVCPVCKGKDSAIFGEGRISDRLPISIVGAIPIEYWGPKNPHLGGKIIEVQDGNATVGYSKDKMVGLAFMHLINTPIRAEQVVRQDENGLKLADLFVVYHDRYGYVIKPVWKSDEEDDLLPIE